MTDFAASQYPAASQWADIFHIRGRSALSKKVKVERRCELRGLTSLKGHIYNIDDERTGPQKKKTGWNFHFPAQCDSTRNILELKSVDVKSSKKSLEKLYRK